MSQSTLNDYQFAGKYPWRNKELMERLYLDEKKSQNEIADLFDCGATTVREWLVRHEIPTRSISEAKQWEKGYIGAPLNLTNEGYRAWKTSEETVLVHRLVAVAVFGFDAVCDMDVHHKDDMKINNSHDNLELLSHGEHSTYHRTKVQPLERIRIAELYENGDTSYRKLHEALDYDQVGWYTLMNIHKEFYGGDE